VRPTSPKNDAKREEKKIQFAAIFSSHLDLFKLLPTLQDKNI
jgi:hypothetical protein